MSRRDPSPSNLLLPGPIPGMVPTPPGNLPIPLPVIQMNTPPPGIDPFMAILYSQFLAGNVWLEWFTFTATWNPLAAAASGAPAVTTIDNSIDFIAQQMNLTAYQSGGTYEPAPNFLMEVQETSGRSTWADGPVHVGNWFGNTRSGALSYWMPTPRYIKGSNTVNWKLTNLVAGTAYRVDVALIGMRVTYMNISREKLFNVPY